MSEPSPGYEFLREEDGACAIVSPDGERLCIKDAGHPGPHGWEAVVSEAARLVERMEDALTSLYGDTDIRFNSQPALTDGIAALRDLEAMIARWERIEEEAQDFIQSCEDTAGEFWPPSNARDDDVARLYRALAAETQGGER